MLQACLQALVHFTDVSYEVIIVDDCSTDSTSEILGGIQNATILRNKKNLDFLLTTNKGAARARGEYILFLNNDVIVREGWLSTLVETIEQYPNCGAVGPKFLNMNGSLQEAGSYVMHDAKVVMYGSSKSAFQPEFSYLREVDYCSAACLLVKANLFREVGGLDERFVPAYYEDPDLCFKLKQLGFKVVFQPKAVVFHHGVGSRPYSKAQKLVETNRQKFLDKWQSELSSRTQSEQPLEGRDRRDGDRVLLIVERIPNFNCTTSVTIELLSVLEAGNYVVTLVPTKEKYTRQPFTRELQQRGFEVFYGAYFNPINLIHQRPEYYKMIIIDGASEDVQLENAIERSSKNSEIIKLEDALQRLPQLL
jgi:GT2 family glycosyltransferase